MIMQQGAHKTHRAKPSIGMTITTPQGVWRLGQVRTGLIRGPWSRWRNRQLTRRYVRQRARLLGEPDRSQFLATAATMRTR